MVNKEELDNTIRDLSLFMADNLIESLNHSISWAIDGTVIEDLPQDEWIDAVQKIFDATVENIYEQIKSS